MSRVTANQPAGTPTWIDLCVPDAERAMRFYSALFGWRYAETGDAYQMCLLDGLPVAGITSVRAPGDVESHWRVYFATDDCDDTTKRVVDAGGSVLTQPTNVDGLGRMSSARDPVGAWFGLWQGYAHPGCQVVNEPNSLVRNDLVTVDPEPARTFYASVFGYTLDRNEDLPDFDFTFLRRPDGHEIGGIFGSPAARSAAWVTIFEVADTDAVAERAVSAGGTAGQPEDMVYGRIATITDPFGAEFSIIARPAEQPG